MKNMLEIYPKGLMACVSVSYDVFKACSEPWGRQLKEAVEAQTDGSFSFGLESGERIVPQIVRSYGSMA